jgi:hypothetical protein
VGDIKRSKSTEEHITFALKQAELGVLIGGGFRWMDIS